MTLPVKPVILPSDLRGQKNGDLDPSLLQHIPGGQLHHLAAEAWRKVLVAAAADGLTLKPTSPVDTYRGYNTQVALFKKRYDRTPSDTDSKVWNGVQYWLKPGYAMAAVPGTSNHGWGLAIDVNLGGDDTRLKWLLAHAPMFGWSWEAQSEPWHIRYVVGDGVAVPAYNGPYKVGARGPAVRAIQSGLGITADGIYGRQTAQAVRAFRRKHPRLWPATTVCNAPTYAAVTKAL